ncbi:tfp pilus assembly protein ATPase PilM [Firmicutes bacterium CAG:95]|nr:tfp pilus assembly protein ATPase PilM [Firmicutes bacterium CAG:95]
MAGKVISIEIGYSLTRVCEVDYKSKTHKVYGYFSLPTPEGMINDGIFNLNGND